VYVEFDRTWPRVVAQLEKLKRAANGTPGKIIAQGRCAMLPGGKPNYPFQVQFADFQLWLSPKQLPEGKTPNVFISLGARLLWEAGVRQAVEKALSSLVELTDGTVRSCRMSRCDQTADFYWPQGLTDEFLRRYAVMRSRSTKLYLKDDQIESFYVGASDADIQLKIYHKSLEIVRSGKDWFRDLWSLDVLTGVWRVEFQTRRDLLRSLDINSVDDLVAKAADLWRYLTTEWFSLRLLDDPNATRALSIPGGRRSRSVMNSSERCPVPVTDDNDRLHSAGKNSSWTRKTELSSKILRNFGSQGVVTLGINLCQVRLAVSQHHFGQCARIGGDQGPKCDFEGRNLGCHLSVLDVVPLCHVEVHQREIGDRQSRLPDGLSGCPLDQNGLVPLPTAGLPYTPR
jgi:hypothetical protein